MNVKIQVSHLELRQCDGIYMRLAHNSLLYMTWTHHMNLGILINYHTVYIWKVRIFRCKGYECLNQTLVSRRRCQPMSSTDFTPIGTICSKESVFICMKLNLKVKVPHPVVSCYCRSCCQKLGALIENYYMSLCHCTLLSLWTRLLG